MRRTKTKALVPARRHLQECLAGTNVFHLHEWRALHTPVPEDLA